MAHLLVIDDEILIRDAIEIMLEHDGHTADLAEDGAAGMEMFNQGNFDLVISDIFMPVKNGFEVLSEIKNINSLMNVLILSGGHQDTDLNDSLGKAKILGADEVLSKPFAHTDLSEKVNQLLKLG